MKRKPYILLSLTIAVVFMLLILLTPSWFGPDIDLAVWLGSLVLLTNLVKGFKAHNTRAFAWFMMSNVMALVSIAFWMDIDEHTGAVGRLEFILSRYLDAPFWAIDKDIPLTISMISLGVMILFEGIGIWRAYSRAQKQTAQ